MLNSIPGLCIKHIRVIVTEVRRTKMKANTYITYILSIHKSAKQRGLLINLSDNAMNWDMWLTWNKTKQKLARYFLEPKGFWKWKVSENPEDASPPPLPPASLVVSVHFPFYSICPTGFSVQHTWRESHTYPYMFISSPFKSPPQVDF